MTPTSLKLAESEGSQKERAIRALTANGFREIGVDGSGLRLFKSTSGALLIGVGSCRCLAYSPTGPDGRLQLVAASRTAALLCRIATIDATPLGYFPIQPAEALFPKNPVAPVPVLLPVAGSRVYEFSPGHAATLVLGHEPEDAASDHTDRDAPMPTAERLRATA